MHKKLNILSLMIVFILSISGFVFAQGTTTIKLGHITAENSVIHQHAEKFSELVTEMSDGELKIDIYPAQQLGSIDQILEGVSYGSIEMAIENISYLEMFQKDYTVTGVPYLVTKKVFTNSELFNELNQKLEEKNNIKVLPGNGWPPYIHLFTKKRPVKTPAELNGIKLRIFPLKAAIDAWKFLGASPIAMDWGEVYMGLAQGIIDGLPHTKVQVYEESFYEHLDYCSEIYYPSSPDKLFISSEFFNGLSSENQEIIIEASIQAGKYATQIVEEKEKEAQATMVEAGVEFVEGDQSSFVSKMKPYYKELEESGEWSKGVLKKLGIE